MGQSFSDFQIIAINDGSTDGSAEILKRYAKADKRISLYHQKNAGLSATRNRGLSEATGKYIYFFDSDDILEAGSLREIIKKAEETDSDIVHFSSVPINDQGNIIKTKKERRKFNQSQPIPGEELFNKLVRTKNYATNVQKYLFKKEFLTCNNLCFDDGFIHEDESFTIISLCLAEKVTSIETACLKKRFRSNSIMSSEKGLENILGWICAAIRLTTFKESTSLGKATENIIDSKIKQLLNNSLKVMYNLKKKEQKDVNLKKYFPENEIKSLGWQFQIKNRYLVLNQIQNMVTGLTGKLTLK